MRTIDVPVLVVGPAATPFTRVLAAVDLSSAAIPTIKAAERLANLLSGRLRIVHVVQPLRLLHLPIDAQDEVAFEHRAREEFERLTASLPALVPQDEVIRIGEAVETIVEELLAWHADLVVVGSHGKGWVDRVLVGSTTERLLNVLPASLLIIPTAPGAKRKARAQPRKQSARERKAKARG